MEIKLADILGLGYKLNDWLNFFWNFYVIFSGVVIGWVFNSKGWAIKQRVIVTMFYLGFVAVSLDALVGTYLSIEDTASSLSVLIGESDQIPKLFIQQFTKPHWRAGTGLHILGDVLVLVCIWTGRD